MRLTMSQALVRFLNAQYISFDGQESRFVEGIFAIFGHGNVVGLGEALMERNNALILRQGRNEQGMAHAAIGFAKQHNRRRIYAVTSSIGPGALNMVTAAATATVNRVPLLLLPGDLFASRQPDPVLQQVERFHDASISANDAFKPVSVYWARIERPEQIMSAAIRAMSVLTDPASCGAVTLALPQDVQAESYDYPEQFFSRRVHHVERPALSESALGRLTELVAASRQPLMICGGGVRYSEAGDMLASLATEFAIPFGETQAGKGTIPWDNPMNLGGIGVTGTQAANRAASTADLLLAVGTRLSDFTTASKSVLRNPDCRVAAINIASYDAHKMNASPFIADARLALTQLHAALAATGYRSGHGQQIAHLRHQWAREVERIGTAPAQSEISQTAALYLLNNELLSPDDIVVSASGSLPGDMQRMWRARRPGSYHMEYGFSCMGYEVNAALGIKLATPQRSVYALVGDGAYAMLHSELITAIQERIKITILLFDNHGFQVIDNLQTAQGLPSYANDWRQRQDDGQLSGDYLRIDWAQQAAGYGVATYSVSTMEQLRRAFSQARQELRSVLLDIKVAPKSMTKGYDSWWRVGVPEISTLPAVRAAYANQQEQIEQARQF